MLVLSRHRDESIIINGNIVVTVVDIRGDKVRLGVAAPIEIPVHRQEVQEAIDREGVQRRPRGGGEAAAPDLLAACEAVLPWVITATAYRAEIHPQAVANHKADLEQLMAAIAKAKGGTS